MENRTRNGGPRAPKPDRLEELIDQLTQMKGYDEQRRESDEILQEVIDALDWTHTMLTNRQGYQKKQQEKRKVLEQWAKQNLSADELEEINRQAERLAAAREVERG